MSNQKFRYVANVPMKDRDGNDVSGVGVVDSTGTFLVACVTRAGQSDYRAARQGSNLTRTIGFGDMEIKGVKVLSEPDESGYIKAEVGGTIIKSSQVYIMQSKDAAGVEGTPFFRALPVFQYRISTNQQQMSAMRNLLGAEVTLLIEEAVNKSSEITAEQDEKGVRQTNANIARAGNSLLKVLARHQKHTPSAADAHAAGGEGEAGSIEDDTIPGSDL